MDPFDPKLYADFREVCGLACENARQWSNVKRCAPIMTQTPKP